MTQHGVAFVASVFSVGHSIVCMLLELHTDAELLVCKLQPCHDILLPCQWHYSAGTSLMRWYNNNQSLYDALVYDADHSGCLLCAVQCNK
jgi:hypothetical protein